MTHPIMQQIEDGAITEYEAANKLYFRIWDHLVESGENYPVNMALLDQAASRLVPDVWDDSTTAI